MIVDDNADTAYVLGQLIGDLGYDVDIAFDPISALQKAESARPAVALIDITLPIMDGNELARRMRELGQIALIAMSGYGPHVAGDRFEASFAKPLDFDRLERVLGELTTPRSA